MDWLTDRPIAHRGLHDDRRPENSLAAFEAAVDAGYPIELDVRLTSDQIPVVFHDESLRRMTGRDATVSDTSWEYLQTLTLFDTAEPIPRLADVLDLVDGAVGLLVELKSGGRAGPLEGAVTPLLERYDGPFAIQSFNPRSLAWFRRHRPDWPRGQLAGFLADASIDPLKRLASRYLLVNWISDPDFIGYEHDRLPYWPVSRWQRRGVPVLAWTVDTMPEYERVTQIADNVIFDDIRP